MTGMGATSGWLGATLGAFSSLDALTVELRPLDAAAQATTQAPVTLLRTPVATAATGFGQETPAAMRSSAIVGVAPSDFEGARG